MYKPLKNPGNQPWKNYALQQETTTFHHKSAEIISREVQSKSTGGQTPKQCLEIGMEVFYCIMHSNCLPQILKLAEQDFAFLLKSSFALKGFVS